MNAPAPNSELLQSLGHLIRGLSALFWGLPLTLIVCAQSVLSDWLRPLGIIGPLVMTSVLFYGLAQLSHFQKQERIWVAALDRGKFLAITNIGLAPFLFWWHRLPGERVFLAASLLFFATSLLFLYALNHILHRLTAMLPDEGLREETKFFTNLNRAMLVTIVAFIAGLSALQRLAFLPGPILGILDILEQERRWIVTFLLLLPVAMTMALIWKIKDAVFFSVFGKKP